MVSFDRDKVNAMAAELAADGIFVGTSSWKYPGWLGQLYTPARYEYRGKLAMKRFERDSLAEYAEVFKSVCVDAAYYKFPDERYLSGMVSQVPPDFQFAFKVTDEITIKKYTNLARFGERAGKLNPNFLNPELFATAFLKPCERFRSNIGLLMFEFSKFYPADYAHGSDFAADLDRFLGGLPKGWPYGVEMRNRHWLRDEYFDVLHRHAVAHIYNSWSDMPPIGEQMAIEASRTNPNLSGARLLLRPGRSYEQSVKLFEPYDSVKEAYEDARKAAADFLRQALRIKGIRKLYLYVNNRLEGNALQTIYAMLRKLASETGDSPSEQS
jgi:uncharacterized protein YecE (DUF72 family)